MRIGRWTPAQAYAVVFSPALVVTGLVGFLVDRGFGAGGHLHGWGFTSSSPVVGLVPVNRADNYFHILDATGIAFALLPSRRASGSRSLHQRQAR